jgi:hypothetical protein
MEAILVGFSDLALGSVQAETVSASYTSLLRDECLARLDQPRLLCLLLGNTTRLEPEDIEATFLETDLVPGAVPPRELRHTTTFSEFATLCRQRLKLQIESRLPKPLVDDIVAMLLDPRTKALVHEFVSDDCVDQAVKQIKHELVVLMKENRPDNVHSPSRLPRGIVIRILIY